MSPSAAARLLLATGLAAGAGCAHHMTLTSSPPGAVVSLGETRVGVTPLDVPVPLLGTRVLHVELTGYRPLTVELGLFPPLALELLLVQEHGAAGTWDPEDVP